MGIIEFEFPDTGEGVTEGTFLEWKIKEGDEVEEDQVLAEAETDKAVVEVPSPSDGTVKELLVEPGDTVEVGDVILRMETAEEDEEPGETTEKEETGEAEQETGTTDEREVSTSSADVLALPKVRHLAAEKGVDLESLEIEGRITEEDVLRAAEDVEEQAEEEETETREREDKEEKGTGEDVQAAEDVEATPAVRKFARQRGVDLTEVDGSGPHGRITRNDVVRAAESGETEAEEEEQEEEREKSSTEPEKEEEETRETEVREPAGEKPVERVEMSGLRRSVAEKMEESRFNAPHVTHMDRADVTELKEMREREKEKFDTHLTYLPFVMKAAYEALKEYPDLNAELDEENDEIIQKKYYDFNIAVDTDRGLLVPVIENVGEDSIIELAEDIEEKVDRARKGELSREEMQGGTFSITNIGVIGGEEFTPIINPPQTAILGIGEIKETAEVVDGEVVPRTTVKLSLSYDHRVVDGATAARFMNEVIENLEDPEKMLFEL
ncbi:MAG: 2-oxo acid dehydrogenase subunit E2 [Candidatus Nanohaloarchaea archaeon]